MENINLKDNIAINFDLDQDVLLDKGKNKKPLKLYRELTKFLAKNNFDKMQQSSYLSNKKINMLQVLTTISDLIKNYRGFNHQ